MKRTKSSKKQKRNQDEIIISEFQENFILSISGSNSEKKELINKSNIWGSSAAENKVKKFAFFTKGDSKKIRYWTTPNLFIIFLNIPNPPIPENYFISHKCYSDKYVSFHLNPAACSNMIYFMNKVKDVLSKNEFFERILLLTENHNIDEILYNVIAKSSIKDYSLNLNLQIAVPEASDELESEYSATPSKNYQLTKEDGELDYSTTVSQKPLQENSESSPSLFISPPSSSDSRKNPLFKAASTMKDTYLDSTSQETVSISSSFRSSRDRRSTSVRPKKREKDEESSTSKKSDRNSIISTGSTIKKSNRNNNDTNSSSRTRRNLSVSRKNRNKNSTSNNSQNDNDSRRTFSSAGSRNRHNIIKSSSPLSRNEESSRNSRNKIIQHYSKNNYNIQEDEYYEYYEEEDQTYADYLTSSTKRGKVQSIKSRNDEYNSKGKRSQRRQINNNQNYEEEEIDTRYSMDSSSRKNRINRSKIERKQNNDKDKIDTRYNMDSNSNKRKRTSTNNSPHKRNEEASASNKNEESSSQKRRKRSSSISTTKTNTTNLEAKGRPLTNTQKIKRYRRSQSISNRNTNNTYDGSTNHARNRNTVSFTQSPTITIDGSPTNAKRHGAFASDHVRYNFDFNSFLSNSTKNANSDTNSHLKNRSNTTKTLRKTTQTTITTITTEKQQANSRFSNDENSSNNDSFVFDLSPRMEEAKNEKENDPISVLKIVPDGTSSVTKTAPDLKLKRKRSGTQAIRKSNSNFTGNPNQTALMLRKNSWNISIDSFDKPTLTASATASNFKYLNESTNPDDKAINSDSSYSEDDFHENEKKDDDAVDASDSIDAALPTVDQKKA